MRTLNVRLLFVLSMAGIIVGTAAYAMHGYQIRKNASVLLREAAAAKDRKNAGQAIGYLQRYIALAPKANVDARAELGLLLADSGRTEEAYRTLEAVLRQDQARNDVRRRLVDVAMTLKRFPDAKQHLDDLLKGAANDSELLDLLAQCQAGMNRFEEAAASFRLAIQYAPERVETYGRLAELTRGPLDDAPGAIAILDEMVT